MHPLGCGLNQGQGQGRKSSAETADLSRFVDKLLPLCPELSAAVRVRLPALEVFRQDALAVVEMQQQSLNGGLSKLHADL